MLPLSTYQLYFDLGAFWVIHDVFQEPPQTLSTMLGSYAEEAPNFESLQFNQPSMQRCLGAGYSRDRHDTSAWNQNGLSSQGSWMWCHIESKSFFSISISFFNFNWWKSSFNSFEGFWFQTAFQAVPLPTFQPPKAQTAFGAKIRAAARMAKAAFLPSEAKAQRCVQLQCWEGNCGKMVRSRNQKGVESEKKTLQGNVEFVKAASFQTQKTQKLDIKIDIQNIQDVFHLQRLVSFLWRGKHHRWNCWRRFRVGETPRYTVFYICRPRSGRAEGEVAELTVQFCCKQISKSQCIMLYDALCIYAMFWRISKSREILAKFW